VALDPVSAALDIGGKLIDRLWPDPTQRDAAKLELLKLQQSGELARFGAEVELTKAELAASVDIAGQQSATNNIEAASESLLKSGWRPATGWVCVTGLGYMVLLRPLLSWVALIFELPIPPEIDISVLLTLLTGLLGLGGFRTLEKLRGAAR
jgi:hypothetical protein